jgi:tRNA1(Val) A37 N6-methylase TrmN6
MLPEEPFATSDDRLLGGRVRLRQPLHGYRAAIDPVLLAAAVPAVEGDSVLDLGCGVGAAALCLLARLTGVRVTGLEVQPELAALARENAASNGFADRFTVVEGSLLAPPPLVQDGYDHVMTNPPFLAEGSGTRAPVLSKATANMEEGEVDLGAWIKAAAKLLRPKGRLALIHRADRLGEVLNALGRRGLGEVRVLPLWPRAGRPAGRVIVTARKGVRTPLELLPGLVLHGEGGAYTEAAEAVLRRAEGV